MALSLVESSLPMELAFLLANQKRKISYFLIIPPVTVQHMNKS